jgi:polynucleotide 5'-kinase involved in rRNA processing
MSASSKSRSNTCPGAVSPDWQKLLARIERGTILVTGGPGHNELARYLLGQLDRVLSRVALVDAGLGRPTVGVPACLGLALTRPWRAPEALWFVGEVDPRRRPLPTVVGAARLAEQARKKGAQAVIVDGGDPAGDPEGREVQLHLALAAGVDQVVAVSRNGELTALARALEAPHRRLHRVPAAPETRRPSPEEVDSYRQGRFEAHFHNARVRRFGFDKVIRRRPEDTDDELRPGRLVGLIGGDGRCLALGVIDKLGSDHLALLTACDKQSEVRRIETGGLELDPSSWAGHEPSPGEESPD